MEPAPECQTQRIFAQCVPLRGGLTDLLAVANRMDENVQRLLAYLNQLEDDLTRLGHYMQHPRGGMKRLFGRLKPLF